MHRLPLAGTFTGEFIRIISNIRRKHRRDAAKLNDCGRFVLADDMSDIADITHIDLSSISSLEGKSTTTTRTFLLPSFTDQSADDASANVPNDSQVTYLFWPIARRLRSLKHQILESLVKRLPHTSFAGRSTDAVSANAPIAYGRYIHW
jgi:hypothetical protein